MRGSEQRTQGITQAGKWIAVSRQTHCEEDKGDRGLSALCVLPALLPAAGLAPTGRLMPITHHAVLMPTLNGPS